MTHPMAFDTSSPKVSLQPRRALLHPLWLGSLATLAINDHLLKGSGIVPDLVAGKLSDFAGLLVAPLLLATLLGVRKRNAWLLAHAAVGFVFAAIQLSPAAADLWASAMGSIAFPWAITPDVTDLVALPMLAVSAWFYPRVMQATAAQNLRNAGEVAVAGTAVALCAATSPPPPDFQEPDLFTDIWLHNATDATIVVRVRPLAPSVELDCDAVEADPGRLLSEDLFGNALSWTLESGENLDIAQGINGEQFDEWGGSGGLEELPPRECMVGLVDIDGVLPAVFFWRAEDTEVNSVPAREWHEDIPGGVMLEAGEDGQARFTQDEAGVVNLLATALPPTGGACAPQSEGDRIAWSDIPEGLSRLGAIDPGVDGCAELTLLHPEADPEVDTGQQWYLCVPPELLPFEAGDLVSIESIDTGASTGLRIAAQEGALEELWIYVGGLAPATKGVTFAPVPDYGCELRADIECGTIARSAVIFAGGGNFTTSEVAAGQTRTLEGTDGTTAIVHVAHAQERVALDTECAEGPDTIGEDVEVAVAIIPAAE